MLGVKEQVSPKARVATCLRRKDNYVSPSLLPIVISMSVNHKEKTCYFLQYRNLGKVQS